MPLIQFVFVIFGCIEKLTDAGAGSSYRLIFLNSHSLSSAVLNDKLDIS